jgi:hypothetical protein
MRRGAAVLDARAITRHIGSAPSSVHSAASLFARLRGASPFFLISGPCALESVEHALFMSDALASLSVRTGIPVIYKTSFDKANRTSADSPRGLGLDASLRAFEKIKRASGLPVITDVHECWQVAPVAEVVDVLQVIPNPNPNPNPDPDSNPNPNPNPNPDPNPNPNPNPDPDPDSNPNPNPNPNPNIHSDPGLPLSPDRPAGRGG